MSHDWPCRCERCCRDLVERDLVESPLAPQKSIQRELYDGGHELTSLETLRGLEHG